MLDPDAEAPRRTLSSGIYLQLRDEILTGTITPASRLNTRALSERFSVGLSPVREALSRLSAEGLVSQSDNRGFAVSDVSVPELLDLTRARCWVNEIALRESIRQGGDDWEEALLLGFHRLSRTQKYLATPAQTNPAWDMAHQVFHRTLVGACGSDWMIDTCERFFLAAERYRHLARLAGVSRGEVREEHRAIMEAAMARDEAGAVALLNAHFRHTADLVQQFLESGGDLRAPRQAEH